MRKETRSGCPVSLSLEVFGDRWTLLVLRDIIFVGARHFRELLASPERISSNILSDRLGALVEHGLLTRSGDPSHKQKITYSLTERAIDLVPVFVQIGDWGTRYLPAGEEYVARGEVLGAGGSAALEAFMDELRETHLGPQARRRPAPDGPSITVQMQDAYESALNHSSSHLPGRTGEDSHGAASGPSARRKETGPAAYAGSGALRCQFRMMSPSQLTSCCSPSATPATATMAISSAPGSSAVLTVIRPSGY